MTEHNKKLIFVLTKMHTQIGRSTNGSKLLTSQTQKLVSKPSAESHFLVVEQADVTI